MKVPESKRGVLEYCLPGPSGWHLKAAAGAGKTFVALHLMLETLQRDPLAHALFVAANPALTVFVAKWLALRINGYRKRCALLTRLHVMSAKSAEPCGVTVGEDSGAIEVLAPGDTPAQMYKLVVLDEAHHACRDPILLAAVLRHHGGVVHPTKPSTLNPTKPWVHAETNVLLQPVMKAPALISALEAKI